MNVGASKDWIQQQYVREFGPKLQPTEFYYDSQGRMVMTENYHMKRGKCCGNGCLHCCYWPPHIKGNEKLKEKSLSNQ
jgi:hypothetical protein